MRFIGEEWENVEEGSWLENITVAFGKVLAKGGCGSVGTVWGIHRLHNSHIVCVYIYIYI